MSSKTDKKVTDDKAAESKVAKDSPKVDAPAAGKVADKKPVAQPAQQQTVTVDDKNVPASYANFCRVSSTPEELILDLGLNPNPFGGDAVVNVSNRVILNHYTAKRLLSALSMALQRHEQAFGVLETDIRKRVKTPPVK